MAKTSPFVAVALVVEDDEMQREMVAMLLQESEMGVIQCENAAGRAGKDGRAFVDDVYRCQSHRPH